MMASEQGTSTSFRRSAHCAQSGIERMKTAARVEAVAALMSVPYVVCIALLLSSAYDLA